MSRSVKVMLAAAVCVCMVAMSHHAHAASNCGAVLTAVNSCRGYLTQGGAVPDNCCNGVKSLNAAAKTPALKKSYCECLKSEARSVGAKEEFASTLPKKCNVNIGYPISYSTNCDSIH
ncbi:hypothetical protein C2S51_008203 [Perilla frutescens var. frutescens]|nr:hypothetical protein C2S51_008203 [Perilla frutescens var. frutescens]